MAIYIKKVAILSWERFSAKVDQNFKKMPNAVFPSAPKVKGCVFHRSDLDYVAC